MSFNAQYPWRNSACGAGVGHLERQAAAFHRSSCSRGRYSLWWFFTDLRRYFKLWKHGMRVVVYLRNFLWGYLLMWRAGLIRWSGVLDMTLGFVLLHDLMVLFFLLSSIVADGNISPLCRWIVCLVCRWRSGWKRRFSDRIQFVDVDCVMHNL